MDDLLSYSRSPGEHLENLEKIFKILKQSGLKLKASKCKFMQTSTKFVGFLVTSEGIKADPKYCKLIRDFPRPKRVKDVRVFTGMAQFYRKFIRDYSAIIRPLTQLTKKNASFNWTEACEKAFQRIKFKLINPPVLAYPDFDRPFRLYTDASDFSVAFVLAQDGDDGKERYVAFGGQMLVNYQLRYTVTEKEMFGVYAGVKYFDHFLRHRPFEVITDHSALTSLLSKSKEPKGKFARWGSELLAYQFNIKHRPGKSIGCADGPSRIEYTEPPVIADPNAPENPATPQINTSSTEPDLSQLKQQQADCPVIGPFVTFLKDKKLPEDDLDARLITTTASDYYFDDDGLLRHITIDKSANCKFDQLVIPNAINFDLMKSYHDISGHFGPSKTYQTIRSKYFWPHMQLDIQHYCMTCHECQQQKTPSLSRKAKISVPDFPERFSEITIDIMTQLKETSAGNKHILCIIDNCTRFTVLRAIKDCTAQTVAQEYYDNWITIFGPPVRVSSDGGPCFVSEIYSKLAKYYDTRIDISCAHVPREHSIVERLQRTIQQALSFYIDRYTGEWDVPLQGIASAIRSTPNETTGYSPNYLAFAFETRKPIDNKLQPPPKCRKPIRDYLRQLIETIETSMEAAELHSKRQQEQYVKRHNRKCKDITFQPGDTVYIYIPRCKKGFSKALSTCWHGPYKICRKIDDLHYELRNIVSNKRVSKPVHVTRLKQGYIRTDVIGFTPKKSTLPKLDLDESDLPEDSFEKEPPEVIGEADITEDDAIDAADLDDIWSERSKYSIEKVIKARRIKGTDQLEYWVKFSDFDHKHNKWLSFDELSPEIQQHVNTSSDIKIVGH